MPNKAIVLGWDGATFEVIRPLLEQGRLPHLRKLMEQGCHGVLRSVIPASSAPAWSSFSTGMNPGKHGVYYFTERIPGSYRLCFAHSVTRRGKPLWMIVHDSGRKVGVINIPGTYPPDCVNGFMISGLDTPSESCPYMWPSLLDKELGKNAGSYAIEPEEARSVALKDEGARLRFVDAIRENTRTRWACAKYLFRKFAPELFILVFTGTDRIQHRLWKYGDPGHPHHPKDASVPLKNAVAAIYEDLDAILGEVCAGMDGETVLFLMSDHGMGRRSDKTFFPSNWLLSRGYLHLGAGKKSSGFLQAAAMEMVRGMLARLKKGMTLKQRQLFRHFFHPIMRRGYLLMETRNIDWDRTTVYANELMYALWINLAGREPRGIVKPGTEYEQLCERIVAELKELKCPVTGEPVMKRVYRRDELYHGGEIEKAPDIVYEMNDYTTQVSSLSGKEEARPCFGRLSPDQTSRAAMSQTSGEHKPEGILLAYGKGIKSGGRMENASIVDVAPTILYAMGEPILREMDGRILEEIFTGDFLQRTKPVYVSSDEQKDYRPREAATSPDEEEELKEKLKSLGYL